MYKRILLKLSGEALMGEKSFGHDAEFIVRLCHDIKEVYEQEVQICIVVGGGNIFRGTSEAAKYMERTSADYIGMLATIINALALQNILETMDIPTRVQSAIPMTTICEPYTRRRAVRHMEKNRVVIFAAGTGNPFFTTDTAAALRAVEMDCDVILKGTQVDGVYSADPHKVPDATYYSNLTYKDILQKDLKVMDGAAVTLAKENNIPIIVFSLHQAGSLDKVLHGKTKYSLIKGE